MDSKNVSSQSNTKRRLEFMLKKKQFDNAPQTVESLLEERRDLYHRLQLSRDELDSYIRYMHRMCDEKGQLSDELSSLKTNNETLTHKCKRLENQNKLLVKESSDLMKMLADFGPKELYNFSGTNPNTEEAIIKKLKESLQVIFDENGKLHQEQDLLKNELRLVTSELNESQKKINDLNKNIDQLEEEHITEKSYKTKYENLVAEHSKCIQAEHNQKKLLGSLRRDGNDGTIGVDTIEQFYSMDSSTPPSIPVFQADSSSILNSTCCKNSFNVDIFDDFPYKLRSYDVYSDSDALNLEDSSVYKSALEKASRNNSNSNYESCEQSSQLNTNITSNNNPTLSFHPNDTTDAEKNTTKLPRKTSTLDSSIDVFGLIVSVRELHQTVRSLFKLLETPEDDDADDDGSDSNKNSKLKSIPLPNAEELLNVDEINSPYKAYENLSSSIESIKKELLLVSQLLAKMNSEFTDVREENDMLAKEISALKYALTCRIELKNNRTTTATSSAKCHCDEKTAEFNQKCSQFEQTISQLNSKIEELTEERTNLFSLITQIANSSDSGNE